MCSELIELPISDTDLNKHPYTEINQLILFLHEFNRQKMVEIDHFS